MMRHGLRPAPEELLSLGTPPDCAALYETLKRDHAIEEEEERGWYEQP